MELGEAIKELRRQRGLTQIEFGNLVGISQNSVCSIETNKCFPQKDTIDKMALVLKVPVAYILAYCIDELEVPEHQRKVFNILRDALLEILDTYEG